MRKHIYMVIIVEIFQYIKWDWNGMDWIGLLGNVPDPDFNKWVHEKPCCFNTGAPRV